MSDNLNLIDWYKKEPEEAINYIFSQPDYEAGYAAFVYFQEQFPDLEIDWLETFEDLRLFLLYSEQTDKIISFTKWYLSKDPKDYLEKYELIEKDLCDYFFMKKDKKKLVQRIDLISKNPVPAIYSLTERLLFQLLYHGEYELAVDYSNAVWRPVSESDQLIELPVLPFVQTLYYNKLQMLYESRQTGNPLNEEEFLTYVVELGFTEDWDFHDKIVTGLKNPLDVSSVKKGLKKDAVASMTTLRVHFMRHMWEKYEIPFILSYWFWDFIQHEKLLGKSKNPDRWFFITANQLKKHVAENLDLIFKPNQLEVFGKVCGLPYVYEFLYENSLISENDYGKMLDNINVVQRLLELISEDELWQMSFLFEWPAIVDEDARDYYISTFQKNRDELMSRWEYLCESYTSEENDFDYYEDSDDEDDDLFSFLMSAPGTPIIKDDEPGRNDPCPCGSGKKYKKCCLRGKS